MQRLVFWKRKWWRVDRGKNAWETGRGKSLVRQGKKKKKILSFRENSAIMIGREMSGQSHDVSCLAAKTSGNLTDVCLIWQTGKGWTQNGKRSLRTVCPLPVLQPGAVHHHPDAAVPLYFQIIDNLTAGSGAVTPLPVSVAIFYFPLETVPIIW